MSVEQLPRSATFAIGAVILIVVAWVLLLTSVGLGITAGEMKVNPNYHGSEEEDESVLTFILFAATEIAFAILVVKSGLLRARVHWAARAAGAMVAGCLISYLMVLVTLWITQRLTYFR
jgi:hypothetical protein